MFEHVTFLDDGDFDDKGFLQLAQQGVRTPAVVLIYSDQCVHCNDFKGVYDRFSRSTGGMVLPAAIHVNAKKPEVQALLGRIKQIYPPLRGLPTILFYAPSGSFVSEFEGRTSSPEKTHGNFMEWVMENHRSVAGGPKPPPAQQRADGAPQQPAAPRVMSQGSHTNARMKAGSGKRKYANLEEGYSAQGQGGAGSQGNFCVASNREGCKYASYGDMMQG